MTIRQLPVPVPVTLEQLEFAMAVQAGAGRMLRAIRKGVRDHHPHGAPRDGWEAHCEGAAAELALAKYLRTYWVPTPDPDAQQGDVMPGYHVRWCPRSDGRLILHRDDPDAPFVLVTGRGPAYTLRGWCWASAGQRQEYWCDPTGQQRWAFFVPVDRLRDMAELPNGELELPDGAA